MVLHAGKPVNHIFSPRPSTETLLGDVIFGQRERVKEEPRGFARRPSPPRTPQIGHMNLSDRFEATDDDVYNVPSSPEVSFSAEHSLVIYILNLSREKIV